jgi:TonB family protein
MAHQSTFRPDPPEHHRPADEPPSPDAKEPDEADERDAGLFLAHLATTLARHGGGASSADLALDLVLNEIVEQAHLATTATGAAIALVRRDELVCRATSGANAPDLGVRLNTHSGLSGACVLTRQVQRCDDTEADSRVDAVVCRQLNVRSILVLPVLAGEELVGVFEIFSPRPNAFSDRDIQTVEALSRRIVDNVRRAAETETLPQEPAIPTARVEEPVLELPVPQLPAPRIGLQLETPTAKVRPHDYWTGALAAIVIALALLLGWMVGRAGWQSATGNTQARVTPLQQDELSNRTAANVQPDVASKRPTSENKTAGSISLPRSPKATSQAASGTAESDGGLVVYEKGKVIFQMSPVEKSRRAETGLATKKSQEGAPQGDGTLPAADPMPIPPEVASAYLVHRVEPQYPEEARRQHIQGPVVIETLVSKNGIVREAKVISGQSDLAAAAVEAVRQWRFKPYLRNGRAVEFETRVTVNFTLP